MTATVAAPKTKKQKRTEKPVTFRASKEELAQLKAATVLWNKNQSEAIRFALAFTCDSLGGKVSTLTPGQHR
jgi:hypothetical protein